MRSAGNGLTWEERLRTGLMLCAWVALPLGLMTAYTWLRHPILGPVRYQVFLMPGIVLLIAGGVRFRPLTAGGCVAALMLGFTLPVLKTEVFNDQSKPAWREATRGCWCGRPTRSSSWPRGAAHVLPDRRLLPARGRASALAPDLPGAARGRDAGPRDCWLFHDKLDANGEAYLPAIPPSWQSGPGLEFGRLTAARLDPAVMAGRPAHHTLR